jgi:serine/threonine protein kinase
MLTFDGEAKLIDFGIALPLNEDVTRLTRVGSFLGTVQYAAPEQLAADLDSIGPECDVFSLGATLYEMLTLRPLFEGNSVADRLQALEPAPTETAIAFNALLPLPLSAIIQRAVQLLPARRFKDGNEFAAALRTCREDMTQVGALVPSPQRLDDEGASVARRPLAAASLNGEAVFKSVYASLRSIHGRSGGTGFPVAAVSQGPRSPRMAC